MWVFLRVDFVQGAQPIRIVIRFLELGKDLGGRLLEKISIALCWDGLLLLIAYGLWPDSMVALNSG